jgi:hypothetical protein
MKTIPNCYAQFLQNFNRFPRARRHIRATSNSASEDVPDDPTIELRNPVAETYHTDYTGRVL